MFILTSDFHIHQLNKGTKSPKFATWRYREQKCGGLLFQSTPVSKKRASGTNKCCISITLSKVSKLQSWVKNNWLFQQDGELGKLKMRMWPTQALYFIQAIGYLCSHLTNPCISYCLSISISTLKCSHFNACASIICPNHSIWSRC